MVKGGGILNTLIDNLPFELHLPGYNYCGPGTKLQKRLTRGDKGINPLDEACKQHDIEYSRTSDIIERNKADIILANAAHNRFISTNATPLERAAALLVSKIMKYKAKKGMGIPLSKVIKKSRDAVRRHTKNGGCSKPLTLLNVAMKSAKAFSKGKKIKSPRVIPLPKRGGFLPLLPILGALSAVGSLVGENLTEITIHRKCQDDYYYAAKRSLTEPEPSTSRSSSRGSKDFDFTQLCLFYDKPWQGKKRENKFLIQSDDLKAKLIDVSNRRNDPTGSKIINRISGVESLVTVGARYHKQCYMSFMLDQRMEDTELQKEVRESLNLVYEILENSSDCQFTSRQLLDIMVQKITETNLLKQLKSKYGDNIVFYNQSDKDTIICFGGKGEENLSEEWYMHREAEIEAEHIRIIKASAELIRKQIKCTNYNNKSYPSAVNFLDSITENIPKYLKIFLDEVIMYDAHKKQKRKVAYAKRKSKSSCDSVTTDDSILDDGSDETCNENDESIIENTKIKIDQIGLSIVQAVRPKSFISPLHLATGTYLNRKCDSKTVINMLAKLGVCSSYHSIALHEISAIKSNVIKIEPSAFVQYVFDNADHNPSTLDGLNSFHCMGGICCVTPSTALTTFGEVPKLDPLPTAVEISDEGKINIEQLPTNEFSLESIEFVDIGSLKFGDFTRDIPVCYSTHIWGSYLHVNLPEIKGFMDRVSSSMPYTVSRIQYLPFIEENPSDLRTVYTSLLYAAKHARRLDQKTKFVTFDYPLYMKAQQILCNCKGKELENVVARIGGFHQLMSYFKAVGTIMEGSGLKELWGTVYATNSIDKMFLCTSFARALRAHITTAHVIGELIAEFAESPDNIINHENIDGIKKTVEPSSIEASPTTADILEMIEHKKLKIQLMLRDFTRNPPTLDDINTDEDFISMRNLFSSAVGVLKNRGPTAELWLQYFDFVMLAIRTEKAWAGIWTDMTIEQMLMRTIHTGAQGLSHGRTMTSSLMTRFLEGMPYAIEIMNQLEDYVNIRWESSDQHVDVTPARQKRDASDRQAFKAWFQTHNPFTQSPKLQSLSTGLVGDENTDCHRAIPKGLATVMINDPKIIETALLYELAPFPMALFDDKGIMRESKKSELYDVLKSTPFNSNEQLEEHKKIGCAKALVELPHGEDVHLYFKHYKRQLDVPFVIYADFESILEPLEELHDYNNDYPFCAETTPPPVKKIIHVNKRSNSKQKQCSIPRQYDSTSTDNNKPTQACRTNPAPPAGAAVPTGLGTVAERPVAAPRCRNAAGAAATGPGAAKERPDPGPGTVAERPAPPPAPRPGAPRRGVPGPRGRSGAPSAPPGTAAEPLPGPGPAAERPVAAPAWRPSCDRHTLTPDANFLTPRTHLAHRLARQPREPNASAGVDVPRPASYARLLDRARLGPEPSVVGKLDALKGASEESIRLIQLYSTYNALWDPKDPKYLNKNQREDSWRQISAQINMPVKEVKNKMVSFCGSYRREKSKEKKSRITGSGAADVYNSKWFGYPYFHFLKDKNETGDTQETMPNAIPESSQISDVERHTETENAPTKSQLPEASIEEAPPQQQQDLALEASMPSPSKPARKKKTT
ncbi:hypothetical protein EVAR_87183_1 [Eumeta japonica]|uniref:MADF domain-containing protein n=1 Tax=Eumeta variegata TaxID=151549 RepID=A0A4C1VW64_EUMVA|nr:hypothetical protein EVAR_87183_1 [Eumeta japonica]